MATIAADQLSETIVRSLFRELLQDAVDAGEIADASSATRTGNANMVLSEFPSRDVLYPHIIVGEAADTAQPVDIRAQLFLHTYTVRVDVFTTNSTQLYQVRDQVRNWLETNIPLLNSGGFHDPFVVSSQPMEYDPTQKTKSWRILVQGEVYTAATSSGLVIDGGGPGTFP